MCASVPKPEQLTLEEKIGQLFVYDAHGVYMSESSSGYQEMLRQVRENKVGGIIWFVSNVYETSFLTEKLQREAKIPLLVSADLEAGVGMRFEQTTFWPPAMAVAATGDPSLAEQQGRITAREARTIGVNHIFAPVADVNVDPDNPVINARSYGEDPQQVAKFVAAFIRGVQSEGALATAKHFPGHGDTHVDSHRSLPVLDVTRERLDEVELVPFRAAIDAGVKSVMIGHLSIPSLDPTPAPVRAGDEAENDNPYGTSHHETTRGGTLPATLSKPVIEGLLRKELGFDGLIVSDAFDMGGLVAHFDPGEAAVRAIEAGMDQIEKTPDVDAAIAAVKEAVRSGRISEQRIDESVRRILDAKKFVSAHVGTPDEIFRTVDSPEHRKVAEEIAKRAITLVREEGSALPLRKDANVAAIVVTPEGLDRLPAFAQALRSRLANPPRVYVLDLRSTAEETRAALDEAQKADVIVLALAVRARSGASGNMVIPETVREALDGLQSKANVITIAFGTPYLLRDLPRLETYLCAYGVVPDLQVAAVRAIFGEAPISGKLPVTLPGLYRRGHGIVK